MKAVRFNFITVLVLVLLLAVVAIGAQYSIDKAGESLKNHQSEMNETISTEEVSDVEGWGFLLGTGAGIFSAFAIGIVWVFFVLFPAVFAVLIFVPLIIAKLVYKKGKGVTAYRVWMTFTYIFTTGFALLLCGFIYGEAFGSEQIVLGIPALYTLIITVMGAYNTYSDRIKEQSGDDNVSAEA